VSNRPLVVMDIECYSNFFLVMFKRVTPVDGKPSTAWFKIINDNADQFDEARLKSIIANFTIITFNGNNYDIPMLTASLNGYGNPSLKELSDEIILGNLKPWNFFRREEIQRPTGLDHIDLMEVAPGKASLKLYGARLGFKKLQELPIEPDSILTYGQCDIITKYCENDLGVTIELFKKLESQINLRESMGKKYKVDLRSKSDAQIAETVICKELESSSLCKLERPSYDENHTFKYKKPEFIKFETDYLKSVLETIESEYFSFSHQDEVTDDECSYNVKLPRSISNLGIVIGNTEYKMGIGGIHSKESAMNYVSDGTFYLWDADVRSYYPSIISNLNLAPLHFDPELQETFLTVYRGLIGSRVYAKKRSGELKTEQATIAKRLLDDTISEIERDFFEKRLADIRKEVVPLTTQDSSGKLVLNSSFGKFGSKWSKLFSPELLIQVTLTGQLSLLMLIEKLDMNGLEVISANTDGVVCKVDVSKEYLFKEIVKDWEVRTKFDMEFNQYSALYSRDVNNYIAIKYPSGDCKLKGCFGDTTLSKNPASPIIYQACVDFLTGKSSIETAIWGCKDFSKFLSVRTVKGGGEFVKESDILDTCSGSEVILSVGFELHKRGWWTHEDMGIDQPIKTKDAFDIASKVILSKRKGDYLGKVVRWYYSKNSSGYISYKINKNKVPTTDGSLPVMDIPDHLPKDIDYYRYRDDTIKVLKSIGYDISFIQEDL